MEKNCSRAPGRFKLIPLVSRNGPIDDWVDSSVAGWINSEVSQQEKAWGSVLPPSLLFVHIPIQSTNYTQNLAPYSDEVGGVTDERPESFTSEGRRYEGLNVDKPLNTQGHGGGELIPSSVF